MAPRSRGWCARDAARTGQVDVGNQAGRHHHNAPEHGAHQVLEGPALDIGFTKGVSLQALQGDRVRRVVPKSAQVLVLQAHTLLSSHSSLLWTSVGTCRSSRSIFRARPIAIISSSTIPSLTGSRMQPTARVSFCCVGMLAAPTSRPRLEEEERL